MDNNNENQLYMQGIMSLPHVDVTCPNCGQEMEVELPKGVAYAEDINDSIARMKTIESNKEIKRAKDFFELIRAEILHKIDVSNIFNRKRRMKKLVEYVELIQDKYERQ
jgi:hypothetical protein